MDFFVFPHCEKAEQELSKIEDCGRLFAYPATPVKQKCHMTILDSGAYGFFQSGRKMTVKYFDNLSEHYKKYYSDKMLCVAPDMVCNPMQTMQNFAKWHRMALFSQISPVIQPDSKHSLNLELYKYQIDYYIDIYHSKSVFLSNWLSAEMAISLGIQKVVDYAKSKGIEYIHVFGAGWSMADVILWNTVRGVNSCDSIAYYTNGSDVRFGSPDPAENARRIVCNLKK